MKYWINVHHPRVRGETRQNQCKVYVQEKGRRKASEIQDGDLAFIYETGALSGEKVEVVDESGKRTVQLDKGRKGIIALVQVSGSFHPRKWRWHNIPFVGFFNTQELACEKSSVSLNELDKERKRSRLPLFNPRIYGGIRELSPGEFRIFAWVIGYREG